MQEGEQMNNILYNIYSIGVLILDDMREVHHINTIAKQYDYYLDDIIDIALDQGTHSFCLLKYPAEITVFPAENHTIFFIHPLNELVRFQKEKESLKDVRNELNEVINSSFDGIVISDKNGIIIHQNPAYEQITGLSTRECIGRSLKELEEEQVIDVSASLKALEEKKQVTIMQQINTGVTALVSAVPIRNKHGEIEKIVNNVRDLTHLNALESEIQQLEKQNQQIHEELEMLKELRDPAFSLIAHSEEMKNVLNRAMRVAQIDSGVLIQGASGVGKEKIVELIHQNSFRKEHPLIKINCGAIPESLLESELFGYESGSFTGAHQKGKAGLFEAADHGIIFLDEIGEMPIELQVKLLRILQEHEFTRVGGTTPITVDIRIIAATNRDLAEMVKKGEFREDLYYRLNVIPIKVPALKERKNDIIPLIYHFLNGINHKYGLTRRFTNEALHAFTNYDWPGNVRELENLVERIALMSPKVEIGMDDILKELQVNESSQFHAQISSDTPSFQTASEPLKVQLEWFEAKIIKEALRGAPSIRKAASALKVDQSTLVRKMKKHGIEKGGMTVQNEH